jgi:hypothetical protein
MPATCQPLPNDIAAEMLQVVTRAICDRPGDNPAQRDSRTRQMIYTTMGFEPRDGLEYMLTTMVVGHYHLLLDSMSDIFQGQMDQMKARTKTTIVALDRSMLGFVKEMRVARRRPAVRWSENASGGVAEAMGETAEPAPETVAAATAGADPETVNAPQRAVSVLQTMAADAGHETVDAPPPVPAVEIAASGARGNAATPEPLAAVAPTAAVAVDAKPPATTVRSLPEVSAPVGPRSTPPSVAAAREAEADDRSTEEHIAAFQEAFVAMAETLAEARALDGQELEMAATGD